MKFIFTFFIFFICAAAVFSAEKQTLHIYNWSNYIDKNVIIDFEARYKVLVQYNTYDSVEELRAILEKLAFAPDVAEEEIDLIIFPGFLLKGLVEQNLLAPVRKPAVKNMRDIFPILIKHLEQVSEEIGRDDIFALPYLWGTTGLAYDANALRKRNNQFPLESWDLIFNPQLAAQFSDCGIVLADRPREIFQILRHHLGKVSHSRAAEDLTQAELVLRALRPYVDILPGFEAANALAYGDACIVMGQSQEIFLAQKEAARIAEAGQGRNGGSRRKKGAQLSYRTPQQGTLLWMDVMAIPVQTRKLALAHKWINHVLDAENSRRLVAVTDFATPSRRAVALLPRALRQSKTLYPSLTNERTFMDREILDVNDLPDEVLRDREIRAWERFINSRKR